LFLFLQHTLTGCGGTVCTGAGEANGSVLTALQTSISSPPFSGHHPRIKTHATCVNLPSFFSTKEINTDDSNIPINTESTVFFPSPRFTQARLLLMINSSGKHA